MRTFIAQPLAFLLFHFFAFNAMAQNNELKPGFEKEEFIELLKVSSRQGDSLYNPNLPAPEQFQKVYRSRQMGLDNRWELWLSENRIACISIRGTTKSQLSWLDNFYAAMVPAQGSLKLSDDFIFDYHLSDDKRAAVHTGWLIGTAFLAQDILPKLDSLYKSGYKDFLIIGHSQGGAISYLLSALLLKQQKMGKLAKDIRLKTYCSAAPKPGNLYFAYDYENMTKGGWCLSVSNAADWVPQSPFTIQTVDDYSALSPFTELEKSLKKLSFKEALILSRVYNQLNRPTQKANKQFQKYLGKKLEVHVRKALPQFEAPSYANTFHYVRTGQQIILYPDSSYYHQFPQDEHLWINHMFEAYLHLAASY